jgi:hypothetical protein
LVLYCLLSVLIRPKQFPISSQVRARLLLDWTPPTSSTPLRPCNEDFFCQNLRQVLALYDGDRAAAWKDFHDLFAIILTRN